MRFKTLLAAAMVCSSFQNARADALKYQFKDLSPVYAVTIKAEMPDCDEIHSGHISYTIHPIDPSNGQITFDCRAQLQTHVENTQPRVLGSRGGRMMAAFTGETEHDTMVDSYGKVLRSTRRGGNDQLPFMLGPVGGLLVQPLSPEGQETWKIDSPIMLYSKEDAGWPPRAMFGGQQAETDNSAHQTITFTRKSADGNLVTVQRDFELVTDEKIGDTPVEKQTSTGQFVFDTQSGVVQSIDLKQTIEVTQKGVTVKIPVTVSAKLLSGDDLVKWKEDEAAAEKKQKADMAALAADHAHDTDKLPDGATKTEVIGLDGGGPYMRVHKDLLPVIGFTIKIGNWGHTTIGSAIPLFEKADNMHPTDATVCLAKDGYVVGGVIVNSKDGADGLRIIFMKKTANGVDPKTSYMSEWFGYTGKGTQTTLDGKGKLIIGTYGRQGMNMNKIGLIIAGDKAKE